MSRERLQVSVVSGDGVPSGYPTTAPATPSRDRLSPPFRVTVGGTLGLRPKGWEVPSG